ncbi:hypothetical protein KR038_002301, partial [Drosophila bunnanda]
PEEIIDITEDDDVPTPASTPSNESGHKCPICLLNLLDPATTNCGHVFCSICLYDALTTSRTCPICNSVVSKITRLFI